MASYLGRRKFLTTLLGGAAAYKYTVPALSKQVAGKEDCESHEANGSGRFGKRRQPRVAARPSPVSRGFRSSASVTISVLYFVYELDLSLADCAWKTAGAQQTVENR